MRHRTRLIVDLNLFAENISLLKKLAPKNEILFMVKANGYGHGLVPLVKFCVGELGITSFGCATLGEAAKLRNEIPDLDFEIYVFSDVQLEFPKSQELYLFRRIIPVISSLSDLDIVTGNSSFNHFPICLKFNCGMNRLGISPDEVEKVVSTLKKSGREVIYHLFTHFSSSFEGITTGDITNRQYDKFKEIKSFLIDSGIEIERSSVANSGAIEQKFSLEETHIRPGLMAYGPSSLNQNVRDKSLWRGVNISRLESYVIQTFKVKKGQEVGYGAVKVPCDGIVAMIAIGYGDGFSTTYGGLKLNICGEEWSVFGRVNMDMIQLFSSNSDTTSLKSGDMFNIWGKDPKDIYTITDQTGIIPYEVFCQLTVRVPRVYEF